MSINNACRFKLNKLCHAPAEVDHLDLCDRCRLKDEAVEAVLAAVRDNALDKLGGMWCGEGLIEGFFVYSLSLSCKAATGANLIGHALVAVPTGYDTLTTNKLEIAVRDGTSVYLSPEDILRIVRRASVFNLNNSCGGVCPEA